MVRGALTVLGMYTASLYVPGWMKMVWGDVPLPRAATAAAMVLYCSDDPTTRAPVGGDWRDAADASKGRRVISAVVIIFTVSNKLTGSCGRGMKLNNE